VVLNSVNTAPGLTRHGDMQMAAKKKAVKKAKAKAKPKKAAKKK
jgi:D-alanine-D-alanine ligase-like ATP-grasp enzyme